MIIEFIYPILLLLDLAENVPGRIFFALCFLFIVLATFLIWVLVRNRFNKKLLLQKEEFKRKALLEKDRMRIAMDLHDDIGASLTALHLMTSLLSDVEVEERGKGVVAKINEVSDKMVQDMNEIVWALNVANDTLPSLMSYTRETISTLLSNAEIAFEESEPIGYPKIVISGVARRNVFMIVKELVNNAIKHSGSDRVRLIVRIDDQLRFVLSDFGRGITDPTFSVITSGGNGLNNVKARVNALGGSIDFKNENGLTVRISIPLNKFNQAD
jgi:signal transduction histidine kinase